MTSNGRIVRQDRVEIYRDRDGRLPRLVWAKEKGALLLVEDGDQKSVLLLRESHPPVTADLATVRNSGTPNSPFGSRSLSERALRLGIGEDRVIVAFTGEATDLSDSMTDIQLSRLTGEMDVEAAATGVWELWQNRHFWRESLKAANAWRDLLGATAGRSPTVRRDSRRQAARGGAGAGARYSKEFREHAIAIAQGSNKSVATVAGELRISPTTLRRWISESTSHREFPEG